MGSAERAGKPDSVMREHLSMRPTRRHRTSSPHASSYLALLRLGFTEPLQSPEALVVSYTTVSPSPVRTPESTPSAVCSLLHFPEVAPAGISPVACSMESGLSSSNDVASVPLALSSVFYPVQPRGSVQRAETINRYTGCVSNARNSQCRCCRARARWCSLRV